MTLDHLPPQSPRWFFRVVAGLILVAVVLGVATFVLEPEDRTVEGRIVGPGSFPGMTIVDVRGGPRPGQVELPTVSTGGAAPGEAVRIGLGGACRCRPFVDEPAPESVSRQLAVPVGGLVVIGALVLLQWRSRSRRSEWSEIQAASAAVLTLEGAVRPVVLQPVPGDLGEAVALGIDLLTPEGSLIGHVRVAAGGAFDPLLDHWMVGEAIVGAPVALVSKGRAQVVLPASVLLAGPAPAAPWTDSATRLIGWARDAGPASVVWPHAPDQPDRADRFPPLDSPSPRRRDDLEAQVAAWRRVNVAMGRALLFSPFVAIGPCILLGLPVVLCLVVPALGLLLARPIGARSWRRVVEAIQRSEPGVPAGTEGRVATAYVAWARPGTVAPPWSRPVPLDAT